MRTIFLLFTVFLLPVQASEVTDVEAFFGELVERTNRFDPRVADFYSDNARIFALRDEKEHLELTGKEWKLLYQRAAPIAKLRGDVSTYSEISITPRDSGYRISAVRWSTVKCYSDTGFYMDVARNNNGWTIEEQRSNTISLSLCKPSDGLAAALKAIRDGITPLLPLALDADTRLDSVEIVGPTLVYGQVLHTISEIEMDMDALVPILQQLGLNNVCGTKEMLSLLDLGANVRYVYVDKNGVELAVMDVFRGLCG